MKKQIHLSIMGVIISASIFAQTTKRALFLGNSYTDVNNLPKIISDIAISTGDTLIYDKNVPGGYTLQGHFTNTTSLNKIMLGNWNFVVLQEQSQLPSFNIGQVRNQVFPYARALDSVINVYNPCAETMFYMTWGRKNGDASNCPTLPSVCTYESMDSMLHLRYMMMADSNNAVVSPVGAVWKYIRQNYPLIELYQADESHPSLAGSYAAACCFYTAIFKKNPLSITNNYSLPAIDAASIRAAAKTIVYDSLLNWHIGEYKPTANFSFDTTNNIVAFNNLSTDATYYEWNFGDGDTSSAANPVHTYANGGNYPVTLIAYHCNVSDTTIYSVNFEVATGVENYNQEKDILFYPNPVSYQLTINSVKPENISITNAIGQTLTLPYTITGQSTTIDFSASIPGIYFLTITTGGKVITQKIIKQ